MRTLLALMLALFLLGCDDVTTTQQGSKEPSTPQEQEYTIGGYIQSIDIHDSGENNVWFTHVGFIHDDHNMQEFDLCDGQSLLKPGMHVVLRLKGVAGDPKGCYKVLQMVKLD